MSAPLRVLPCSSWSGDAASDGWSVSHEVDGGFTVHNKGLCLDTEDGVPVASMCASGKASQLWRVDSTLQRLYTGATSVDDQHAQCLTVAGTSYSVGPGVLLAGCNPTNPPMWHKPIPGYKWTWALADLLSGISSAIMSEVHDCCGDIWATRPVCVAVDKTPTCSELLASGNSAAWCDVSLNANTRAKALIANMTLDEKASNMDSLNFGVARLAVPPNLFSEALHGMCAGCGKSHDFPEYTSTGCPTSFPQVISMGASWNRSLWTAIGTAVSDEVRGLYSQGSTIAGGWESALFLWAPNINPFRGERPPREMATVLRPRLTFILNFADPRWGRGQEVVSEEPLVCAEYAANYIPALQGIVDNGEGKLPFLKTVATAKHYFDYDLEGVHPQTRQEISVNVSKRDQVEYFSPPFESAVKRGKTQSVMCS